MSDWTKKESKRFGDSQVTTEYVLTRKGIIYRDVIQDVTSMGGLGKVTDIKYVVIPIC